MGNCVRKPKQVEKPQPTPKPQQPIHQDPRDPGIHKAQLYQVEEAPNGQNTGLLTSILKKRAPLWKYFDSPSATDNFARYMKKSLSVKEFENTLRSILKSVQVSRIDIKKRLDFQLKLAEDITDVLLDSYGNKVVKYMGDLQGLTVSYSGSKLTSDGMNSFLVKMSRSLTKLQRLALAFKNVEILNDNRLGILASELSKSSTNLKRLRVYIERCSKVTSKGIGSLLWALNRYMASLTELELDFINNVDDRGIEGISRNLHRYLRKLTSFSLKIKKNNQQNQNGIILGISDRSLEVLGDKINKNLVKLQHLTLWFGGMNNVSNKGVEALISKICEGLPELKSLSLAFPDCGKINDSTLSSIVKLVQANKRNLKKFYLDVSRCPLVTMECVEKTKTELSFISEVEIFAGVQFIKPSLN